MGKHMLLKGIVDELRASPCFAILADEVTSHNVEHLAICARFVDSNIREEFLTFVKLERMTGENVAEAILEFLRENYIPVANMRRQGYNGASNMASNKVGVQARIKQEAPLAVYVHCNGHCLNLVISKSCSLPQVRNVVDRLLQCSHFFLYPKRNGTLEMIVTHNIVQYHPTTRKSILDFCKTRWAECHNVYQHFYQSYVFIVEALEMIGYGHHLERYDDLYADWDQATCSEAQQILASITSFEFIIVFLTVYQYLSHLAGITMKLQRKALDIIEAHKMISEVTTTYKETRNSIDASFSHVLHRAKLWLRRLAVRFQCHALYQGKLIVVMLKLPVLWNILNKTLQFLSLTT